MGSKSVSYWNGVADRWERDRPQQLWRAHADRVNRALLEAFLPAQPVERALKTDCFDEAVGESGVYPSLATAAKTVVAVDLSPATLRRGREGSPGLVVAASDVCRMAFADASFDLVFSNSTLDHMDSLDDVAAGLAEIHRVLRPGGRLLLTLDNAANPVVALRNALPRGPLARIGIVPYHVGATCGARRLARMTREAGFAIEATGTSLHCPRVLAVHAASLVERYASPRVAHAFLRHLAAWERLDRWPTRQLTGYYVTVTARRPRSG